ncbi:MAG TPA: DUF3368 domain-containing protein [Saprospiraceae bacterium]|nr:DUF3368 domain-containing protein [Saprospiraceae bacterium]
MSNRIIIADTTCLIALSRIARLEILKTLFSEIHISSEIKNEFGEETPEWIIVKNPKRYDMVELISYNLDLGEATAISLAIENPNSLLIIDEKKGRKVAKDLGLNVIGLLGILIKAKERKVINSVSVLLNELEAAEFRISQKLRLQILKLVNEN